ncbi:Uncharacterized protein involved in exopolysaccharide biosynthesis [Marivita hallyeonensis]|uniref:Uncharacterized protein involved in exopolysaccharide biosynthesis n=1 Tax=Marivita hallyeonensis TaxID=996342 RepID=A0A1M5U867_9RHOB|nr:Uncharacterized protein involved in exopolysaccharide biosynthesis [Marivita hallyeonensis]
MAVAIGGYYAYRIAIRKFSATTTIALQVQGSQIVDIESVVSGVSSDFTSLNTEIEVIKSRKLGEQLVQRLNLTADPDFNPYLGEQPEPFYQRYLTEWFGIEPEPMAPPTNAEMFDATVANAMSTISAALQRNTYIFTVTSKTVDPQKSVLLANTLADIYIADQIAVKFEATENAVAWLSDRVTELEIELKTKEDEIKELRGRSNLISPEALEALNQQANDLQDRLDDLRSIAGGAEARLAELRGLQADGDPQAMRSAFADPVLQRLFIDLPAGGSQARDLFGSRFALLVQREANDTERAVAQAVSLERSYAELQSDIAEKTQDLVALQQLEREAEATRVLYDTFLARLKETTVQRGLQEADARVLSPAINGYYVEPRKTRILALSLILGSMLGIGIVLLQQFLHNGFRTAEDLERHTGINVMGQLPKMPISRRNQLVDYLQRKPTSVASEAIRNLRTSVVLSNIDNPPKVIMSTSSIPGEGKTTQAIALAHNFVGLGKKVLLIEGDIRRRAFGQYFINVPEGGVVSALSGEKPLDEIVFHDPTLGADVWMGLMARRDVHGFVGASPELNAGDTIRILSGPFADTVAKIETLQEGERLRILMDLMGQSVRMSVASNRVEKLK